MALNVALPRPFLRYWLSGFLDNLGDGVRLAAFPLLAIQVTHAPTAIATVTALQGLPWVLGPAIGAVVDRTDRRRGTPRGRRRVAGRPPR